MVCKNFRILDLCKLVFLSIKTLPNTIKDEIEFFAQYPGDPNEHYFQKIYVHYTLHNLGFLENPLKIFHNVSNV